MDIKRIIGTAAVAAGAIAAIALVGFDTPPLEDVEMKSGYVAAAAFRDAAERRYTLADHADLATARAERSEMATAERAKRLERSALEAALQSALEEKARMAADCPPSIEDAVREELEWKAKRLAHEDALRELIAEQ